MGWVKLHGPFPVSRVYDIALYESPGIYCFSRGGRKIDYVGRSDWNLRSRLIKSAEDGIPRYTYFWFGYETSPMRAYQAECALFHEQRPPDNSNSPGRARCYELALSRLNVPLELTGSS